MGVTQVTPRWGLVSSPLEVVKKIRLGFSHSINVELGTGSIVLADNGAGWPQLVAF